MPSYRVTISIGALRPGVSPSTVLPSVAAATAELAIVEASSVEVVAGAARIIVRFSEDDGDIARQIAEHTASFAHTLVDVRNWTVTRRMKNNWLPL